MNLCLIPVLLAIAAGSVAQTITRHYPVSETAARNLVTKLLKQTPVAVLLQNYYCGKDG